MLCGQEGNGGGSEVSQETMSHSDSAVKGSKQQGIMDRNSYSPSSAAGVDRKVFGKMSGM